MNDTCVIVNYLVCKVNFFIGIYDSTIYETLEAFLDGSAKKFNSLKVRSFYINIGGSEKKSLQ